MKRSPVYPAGAPHTPELVRAQGVFDGWFWKEPVRKDDVVSGTYISYWTGIGLEYRTARVVIGSRNINTFFVDEQANIVGIMEYDSTREYWVCCQLLPADRIPQIIEDMSC